MGTHITGREPANNALDEQTISRGMVMDALEVADIDGSLRHDYSGRGMFGDRGWGVTVSDVAAAVRFGFGLGVVAAAVDEQTFTRVTAMAATVRYDEMGRDLIMYFPGWSLRDDADG